MEKYTCHDITILKGLEPVRRRPGMYVGDVSDGSGLNHLFYEVLGNAIDQHLAGRVAKITVAMTGDEVSVEDDGDGIVHDVRCVLTTLSMRPTWDDHFPHVHVAQSMRGVGLAPVNALSAELVVETRGRRLRCSRGEVIEDTTIDHTKGTRVRFRPDAQIFTNIAWDVAAIRARLWELACLNPALTIVFCGEELRAPGGLVDLVRCGGIFPSPVRLFGAHDDAIVEIALQWRDLGPPQIRSFVSQFATKEGTHVEGLWDGLVDAWIAENEEHALVSPGVLREILGEGLVAAVHVALYDPRFGAPTKDRLVSPEGRRASYALMRQGMATIFRRTTHPLTQRFAKKIGD